MAGKTKAATKRAATAALAEKKQKKKKKKKSKIGSVAAAAPPAAYDSKYHILKLIPITQDECIALLHKKGIACDEVDDEPHKDDKLKRDPITLKLPLNYTHIADDFIDDYYSDDDENTNTGKQRVKPDTVRYHYPDNESYPYDCAVVMKLGRAVICSTKAPSLDISRQLCYIGLTNHGEAFIDRCYKPYAHRVSPCSVYVDGKIIDEPNGIQNFSVDNGSVLSFSRQAGFAYRVEIESSVLANRKRALGRIDDVIANYNFCCICQDPFDEDSTDPTRVRAREPLPIRGNLCKHHICETCLDGYFISKCEGKSTVRYMKCPMCNKKSFDIQNKVKDRLFCDLLKARALKSGEVSQNTEMPSATDGVQQISSEADAAMLKKKNEELTKKNEETEREKILLKKSYEELEKQNAELRKRIEELESKPKAVGRDLEETDDSEFEENDVVEVDALPESASVQREQERDSGSDRNPDTPDKWMCTRCTFSNRMRSKRCQVCGTRK